MFRILGQSSSKYCDGLSRRSFVQLGMAGMGSLGLPAMLRAKDQAAASGGEKKDTSVILLWIDGGPGHMDTYDMKPEAPVEYRGIWRPIKTNVPGFEITEMFPEQAKIADKFSVVRSLHHDNGDHFSAGHLMLTGRHSGVSGASNSQRMPFFGSYATKILGPRKAGLPASVAIPHAMSIGLRPGYFGGDFLGPDCNPFETEGDPNASNFQVKNLGVSKELTIDRLDDRRNLLEHFDRLHREVDRGRTMDAMDSFEQDAFEMVAGKSAREAFDLSQEKDATRERYGRHPWGQSTLLARRLVEAGVTFTTVHFGGWDHHWDLEKGYNNYLPKIDQLVSALFTDLADRGLLEKTLVVMCGEFSRTPKMNDGGNGGAPMSMGQPGRDHWGNAMFCLLGGGGVKGGRIVGSTNRLGEVPQDHPLEPGHIHHTIFQVLGMNPNIHFLDRSGRPTRPIENGESISELF